MGLCLSNTGDSGALGAVDRPPRTPRHLQGQICVHTGQLVCSGASAGTGLCTHRTGLCTPGHLWGQVRVHTGQPQVLRGIYRDRRVYTQDGPWRSWASMIWVG